MKIRVQTCLESKGKALSLAHTYDFQYLSDRVPHVIHVEPITFKGKGVTQAGLFTVSGELTGAFTVQCSRCLEDVHVSLRQPLLERFNIQASPFQNDSEEAEDVHEVTGKEIDLLPFIEEEVQISIPFAPVCADTEACRSRRVTVGKDWNILDEETGHERIDPRLAGLAKFFDQGK